MKNLSILGNRWKPTKAFVLEHLSSPGFHPLRLQKFQKGLDNAHIDVLLDPALTRAISELVRLATQQQLHDLSLLEGIPVSEVDAMEALRQAHHAVSLAVSQTARSTSRRELVQLYQLSLVKFSLVCADRELQTLRKDLQDVCDDAEAFSGSASLKHRERLALLTKQHWTIRFRVCSYILRTLRKLESGDVRKLRKSIIGMSWPVSEVLLFNPLLQLGGFGNDTEFMANYPLLFMQANRFREVNDILVRELAEWLPDYLGFPPISIHQDEYRTLGMRRDTGELPGYVEVEEYLRSVIAPVEFKDKQLCWLDNPDNLIKLLGGESGEWPQPGPWRNSHWSDFQRALLDRLENALEQQGLAAELYASAQMPQLVRELGSLCPLKLVHEYLAGNRTRKSLQQQLQLVRVKSELNVLDRVEQAKKDMKQMSDGYKQQALVAMLGGYARLRRDLKTGWYAYRAMNNIKLLESKDDIRLSRSNTLLNEFVAAGSTNADETTVIGHAIIKADLRGSTQLTSRMREKNLNPAAYFSQNLFDPINALLEKFGATKVFIEGDAVILMILEYAGHDQNGMVVARACGLAKEILEVVQRKNRENRHLDLPELELGIGIAYIDEPPTYLFDGGHQITISPAINRADRLSSNAITTLGIQQLKGESGWGVEAVLALNCPLGPGGQQALQRYNVNGIELDTPAFSHFLNEIVLRKIRTTGIGGNADDKYYLGRYPDLAGKNQWLLVREAKVRSWDGESYGAALEPTQKFFEVISDKKILKRLRDKLTTAS